MSERRPRRASQAVARHAARRRLHTLALRAIPLGLVLGGLATAPAAFAASPAATPAADPGAAAASMTADAAKAYDIPAGPLGTALSNFAVQAGVSVQLDPHLVDGLNTRGLRGNYTVHGGFSALLAGSNLEIAQSTPGVWFVRPRSAQSAAADDASTLPAVTVSGQTDNAYGPTDGLVAKWSSTATKTGTPIVETPQSISVVTRDQMNQQNAQTLNAAVRYEAGVTPETRGSVATRYDMLNVRGFSADTYWNGLKQIGNGMYSTPQVDPYLMDRIEVLRGPTSVLYGQAQAGGLLNQESKLPTVTPTHELGVEFGNYRHQQLQADFSGPIAGDQHYLYRFTAIARQEDGQVESTRNERIAVAPSFTWRPDDKTSLTVYALYQRDPASTSYGSVPSVGTALYDPLGTIARNFYDGEESFERFSRTQEALGLKFEHRLNDTWQVRSNARYYHISQDYRSVYGSGLEADGYTLDRASIASYEQLNSFAIDNQVEGNFSTGPVDHTVLAGFDYQHFGTNYATGYGSAPSINVFDPVYGADIDMPALTKTHATSNQYGIYAQDQLRYKKVLMTLGVRQDWANTTTRDVTDNGTPQWQNNHAFTWRGGLTYLFDSGVAPYFSYSESFAPQSGTDITGKAFDPERGHQYELGIKFQPKRYNALFTAAIFDLTRKNLLTTDLANPNYQTEAGEARSRGLELEAKLSLTKSLDVSASYTYLNTVYTKDNSGLQGKHLAAIPSNQASLWAYYTIHGGPLAGLSLGGGGRYTGATYSTDNSFEVRSFFLVDASLRYDLGYAIPRMKGAELYVNAQNLLNKTYVASCYYGNWCAYGYGRQVFAGMNYRW
ncbi:TonB-dependent siderophore receptor [Paraburkholderia sp. Ac-20347]|uniref:TonB-dependent siderophore receptor n=1 Tax=Paraburkholderia sp. Ac-20347 TaxID=2703892 RepID=UPI001F127F15|nr:TonB-dependent siderophore receptor [Paraburkholderia sp. Ac-20347]